QRFSDLVNRLVEAVIEVNDGPAPKLLAQFFSGYQIAWLFKKHCQDSKRLLLQSDAQTPLGQLTDSKIDLEDTKLQPTGWVVGLSHSGHRAGFKLAAFAAP